MNLLLFLLLMTTTTIGYYVRLHQNMVECFFVETSANTVVTASYACISPFSSSGDHDQSGLVVEVSDAKEEVVLNKAGDLIDDITFVTTMDGEYSLCFKLVVNLIVDAKCENTTYRNGFKFLLNITTK